MANSRKTSGLSLRSAHRIQQRSEGGSNLLPKRQRFILGFELMSFLRDRSEAKPFALAFRMGLLSAFMRRPIGEACAGIIPANGKPAWTR